MTATSAKQAKVQSVADDNAANNAQHALLEEIDACQNEIDALSEKASEEILKVEQKFNTLRKPHYEKRNELCAKIPDFWFTTFSNHPQLSLILGKEEKECLSYLSTVDVEDFEDIKAGYKLSFTFRENPYFTNTKLVKELNLAAEGAPLSKSTKIEWKEGKDLTKESEKTQLNGNKKRKVTKTETFFSWLNNTLDPDADEIAEVIKDEVWTNPLLFYLAAEFDNGESEEDEDIDDESVVEIGDDSDDEEQDVEGDEDDDDDDGDDDGGVEDVHEVNGDDDGEEEDDD